MLAAMEQSGHEVWSTDRTPSATERHHVCDLTDAGSVLEMLEELRPDAVIHLASVSSVARSFTSPLEALQNNLAAACNLFEALRSLPRARVLVVGSAEQYGQIEPDELPLREEQPFRPASPYAVSKIAQEYLALQYQRSYGLDVVLVRSFNHSGPGQSDAFVLPAVAHQVALAEAGGCPPVVRVGNLDVRRDFLDVRDVTRAYALLLEQGESGTAYNVCRGSAESLQDLVSSLVQRSRIPLQLENDPARMRPADLPLLVGDPGRLQRRTGWEAEIPMQRTLADILDDWRRRVAGGSSTS
jgi:GDP-4-dehydro-6-deoxy-D-mannose reductase